MLDPDTSIDNYEILCCDGNKKGGGVACYVKKDWSCNTLSVFPREVEKIFFQILLPNSKPITVGTIYCPSHKSKWCFGITKVLNDNMNKIDSVNNEIYILGAFNINLHLSGSYILAEKYLK